MSVPPVATLLDLAGQVAIVTGASGTIGAGIARRLHEAGAAVLLHASADTARLDALAESLGTRVSVVAGDVQHDADAICASAVDVFGSLGILVNNAGIQPSAPLLELDADQELEVLRVNAGGVAAMTRAAARLMTEGGSIINIASIEALHPAHGHSHYAASKAAVLAHTKAAALELGPRAIRVNAVAPGLITRDRIEEQWPEGVRRWHSAAPLVRLGTPEDVADAVLFLASPAARWITGATLVVDGGVLANPTW